jgi:hypothetical protein
VDILPIMKELLVQESRFLSDAIYKFDHSIYLAPNLVSTGTALHRCTGSTCTI